MLRLRIACAVPVQLHVRRPLRPPGSGSVYTQFIGIASSLLSSRFGVNALCASHHSPIRGPRGLKLTLGLQV